MSSLYQVNFKIQILFKIYYHVFRNLVRFKSMQYYFAKKKVTKIVEKKSANKEEKKLMYLARKKHEIIRRKKINQEAVLFKTRPILNSDVTFRKQLLQIRQDYKRQENYIYLNKLGRIEDKKIPISQFVKSGVKVLVKVSKVCSFCGSRNKYHSQKKCKAARYFDTFTKTFEFVACQSFRKITRYRYESICSNCTLSKGRKLTRET